MLARRLLMGGGGSFPTPNPWSGILTPGAITTITNDTYYNSWPVIARMANGSLLCLYTKATSHGSADQNVVSKISADDGASWSAEASVIYHATLGVAVMGVAVLSTGRVIATLGRTGEAGVVYSDDNGATWTAWIATPNSFTQEAFGTGPVVELPGGDLLVTIEGSDTGDPIADRSCHTLLSTDGGDTWGSEVTVRDYATDSRPYYESKLVLLDTNELIIIHRTSGLAGTHYIQRSSDQGATSGGWSTPAAIVTGYGAPSTLQSVTRTLILVTRQNSDAAAIAYTSIDLGVTWGSAVVLDSSMYEMEYGAAVDTLTPGTTLIVYGSQPTSAITNSDIKQILVTEAAA